MNRFHYAAVLFTMSRALPAQTVAVDVDSMRDEVLLTIGPLHIPAGSPYGHHFPQPAAPFVWPSTGWVQGFRVELVDSAGQLLPPEMMHHAGVTNLDRRQLAYPIAERLFAAGRETQPVALPGSFGVPLSTGQRMLLYYAFANSTNRSVAGATLRLSMRWTPASRPASHTVMPIYFDAHPVMGGPSTFDIAPGVTATSAEFTLPTSGRLRYLGGHLHDFGVELRLEDVEDNRVLARLRADRAADGTVTAVDRTRFPFKWTGLRLVAGHRYRAVAVYDNPTCAVVPGGMGILVAVFAPDDMSRWPTVDTADASYRKDLAWLNEADTGEVHRHEGDPPVVTEACSWPRADGATRHPRG